jgi:peptidyl-prolyl cis-trans isomerase C
MQDKKMQMYKMLTLAASVALVAACSQQGASSSDAIQMSTTGPVAETVNGTKVPQSLLESVARQHNLHLENPQQRQQAFDLLTDEVLVAQAAQHESFASSEPFQAAVEAERLKGVADAAFAEYQKLTPISDDMLKAEYDAQSARAGNQAYDFGQLLFANEADALKAEDDIVTGKPFSAVFDAYRTKAKQAKVFTRVRPDQLPEPMVKALQDLKNGETTKVPVKTEYGWHVVHLDIVNPYTPPPFEQVKEGVRRGMQVKMAQDRVKKLRESAKIDYPEGTAPAPVAAPQSPAKPADDKADQKKD